MELYELFIMTTSIERISFHLKNCDLYSFF